MKRKIYGILIIIWMVTIFLFSSQNGDESNGTSDVITNRIVNSTIAKEEKTNTLNSENKIDDELKNNKNDEKDEISRIVRKLAHFTIYLIGGILIFNFLLTFSENKSKCIIISIFLAMLYAITDEFHQLFVFERSAEIKDVFIDTFGATIGVIINVLLFKIKKVLDKKYNKC